MISWTLGATNYLMGVVVLSCIIAIPYYLHSALQAYRRDRTVRARGAGGKLFLAFLFYAIVKAGIMDPAGLKVYSHDGERAVFVEPNLFWKNEKTELQLRFDPEIEARLWMMETEQGYHPFFTSQQ